MEVIMLTAEEISAAYTNAGLSAKRVVRANTESSGIPMNGTFAKLDFLTFTDDKKVDHKYPVLVVVDAKGNKIGNVSVGSIFARKSTGKALQIKKKESDYVGLFFCESTFVNDFCNGIETEIVANLIGKSYKARKVEHIIPIIEIDDTTKKCLHFRATAEEAIKNVESKELMIVTIN